MIAVTVEFIGSLRTLFGKRKCTVRLEQKTLISELVNKLKAEIYLRKVTIDMSNLLIMLNGKEVSVLNSLQTRLNDSDIIKLIPISHGG